jgi:DnaK suppressor protein
LMAIQKAFGRIEDGSYGTCLECLEAIALPRLKAYPEASLCLACKAAGEAT